MRYMIELEKRKNFFSMLRGKTLIFKTRIHHHDVQCAVSIGTLDTHIHIHKRSDYNHKKESVVVVRLYDVNDTQ